LSIGYNALFSECSRLTLTTTRLVASGVSSVMFNLLAYGSLLNVSVLR
jgi:hypothetical protein